jgi:murein DD-endopeptidase MepM/ murein hydrolase activator NlpD
MIVRVFILITGVLVSLCSFGLELKGPLIQGGMVIGQVQPGNQLLFDDQSVLVSEQGVFVIGFDRDAKTPAQLVEKRQGEVVAQLSLDIVARQYKIQRIEGIAKKIMNPSEENLKRIRSESAQVKLARSKQLLRLDFVGAFQWPLKGPISGVFGSQRVYNGVPKRPHYGVDVAAAVGTPVTTPAVGIVTLAHPDMFYSGGTVIIDHGYGVSSTLIHLSKVLVQEGDEVKPGDIVAEVGAGGRTTGPHLDWRMNWFKARIDPQLLVPPMEDVIDRVENEATDIER